MGIKIGIAGPSEHEAYKEALLLAAQNMGIDLDVEISLELSDAENWDALLLPGGGDIEASFLPGKPQQDPHCGRIDAELDKKQFALLDLFVQKKLPVFGICRGMQVIGVYFGSEFCQHLPTVEAHDQEGYGKTHLSHAVAGSYLEKIYGEHFVTNSAHHQAILLPNRSSDNSQEPPFALDVILHSDDGVIEGAVHRELPVIGLQFHPEQLCGSHLRPDAIDGIHVFEYFLSLCKK